MTIAEDLRTGAIALAREGYRVFPVAPGGKTPAVEEPLRQASSDPDRVRRFWTEPFSDDPLDYNIGIATGRGLAVVDIDNKKGKRGTKTWSEIERVHGPAPQTRFVTSPNSGVHIYFRVPDGIRVRSTAGELGEGIDIRGDGGYVLGPGSVIDGRRYQVFADAPIAPIQTGLIPLISAPAVEKIEARLYPINIDTDYAIARATYWLINHAAPAIEGEGGNATAYMVAARVMDFGVCADTALDLMLDHWDGRCEPPWGEQLAPIVENAAQYRQKPIGVDSADVEFEIVESAEVAEPIGPVDEMPPTASATPFPIEMAATAADNALTQIAEPLVDGLLDQGAMSMLFAPPGAGKTFLALALASSVATGALFAGREVHRGLVVYLVAEGGGGFRKRVRALRKVHGFTDDTPLVFIAVSADLLNGKVDGKRLIASVRQAEAQTGLKCVLIVVDTLSRVLAGGDENSSTDMGALVKHLDEIREQTRSHLMVVHHSGKDAARGARGWSGLKAALDTELEVRDGVLHITKQRDLEFSNPIPFKLEGVVIGEDARGRAITSAVARISDNEFEDFGGELTPAEEEMLADYQSKAIKKYGSEYRLNDAAFFLTGKEWTAENDEKASRHSSGAKRSRQTLDSQRRSLQQKSFVKKGKRSQWIALK